MSLLVVSSMQMPDVPALREGARERGMDMVTLEHFKETRGPVAFHGDVDSGIAASSADRLLLLEPPWDLLTHVDPRFVGRTVRCLPLEEARRLRTAQFLKPAAPAHKLAFDAGVYRDGRDLKVRSKAHDMMVLCSEPVHWLMEVRCFVADAAVVCGTTYQQQGRWHRYGEGMWPRFEGPWQIASELALRFVKEHKELLPPGVVIDVGLTREYGWVMVEANAAWCATLYGSPAHQVIDALLRSTRTPSSILPHERRWVACSP